MQNIHKKYASNMQNMYMHNTASNIVAYDANIQNNTRRAAPPTVREPRPTGAWAEAASAAVRTRRLKDATRGGETFTG
jgi:hypothetical protein